MHRQNAALRREVVDGGEHALFHFAGVLGAEDHELAILEAEGNSRRRAHAERETVSWKRAGVVDREVGLAEAGELLRRRPDQHRVHEQRVIWAGADDSHLDPVLRIPTGEAVDTVQPLTSAQVVERALTSNGERLR